VQSIQTHILTLAIIVSPNPCHPTPSPTNSPPTHTKPPSHSSSESSTSTLSSKWPISSSTLTSPNSSSPNTHRPLPPPPNSPKNSKKCHFSTPTTKCTFTTNNCHYKLLNVARPSSTSTSKTIFCAHITTASPSGFSVPGPSPKSTKIPTSTQNSPNSAPHTHNFTATQFKKTWFGRFTTRAAKPKRPYRQF
jgi:hypothetical protein